MPIDTCPRNPVWDRLVKYSLHYLRHCRCNHTSHCKPVQSSQASPSRPPGAPTDAFVTSSAAVFSPKPRQLTPVRTPLVALPLPGTQPLPPAASARSSYKSTAGACSIEAASFGMSSFADHTSKWHPVRHCRGSAFGVMYRSKQF